MKNFTSEQEMLTRYRNKSDQDLRKGGAKEIDGVLQVTEEQRKKALKEMQESESPYKELRDVISEERGRTEKKKPFHPNLESIERNMR